jgi:hypothetical protein
MNEQQWIQYLTLLAQSQSAIPSACVGCWCERHQDGEAFPGAGVSSTLCYGTHSDQIGHVHGEHYLLHLDRFQCFHACRISPAERTDIHGQ